MVIITWFLMLLSLISLGGMLYPALTPYIRKTKQRMRLLNKLGKIKKRSTSFTHIETMLYLVSKNYEPVASVHRFFIFTLLLFVASFFTIFFFTSELTMTLTTSNPFGNIDTMDNLRLGIGFSIFISLIVATTPYLILRVRYMSRKVKAGYDLLELLKVMSRHAHLAVDTSLSRTADELPVSNVLKRPLKLLSFSFTSYTYEDELQREAERFVRVIGSTFAVSFSSDLIHEYKTGGGMGRSLETLITSMENQLLNILEGKSEMSDAIHLGTWINMISIIVVCGGTAISIGWSNYARLQFQTVQGVIFLGLILISTLASFVIGLFLNKPRLDYK